ncbi:MAG: NADH:ubiquinone oxidoreductase subunit NDUFA12 [Limibacillus sp.]
MASNFGTWLFTRFRGEEVGRDQEGNVYFREKGAQARKVGSLRRERRWVIYKDEVEASRVPPEWHSWLHHWSDEVPPPEGVKHREWEKPHQPNLTGTELAYRPPGHTLKGGVCAPTGGDYEAWKPE